MNLKIDLSTLLANIFEPVINFLKEKGIWDLLVTLWHTIASLFTKIWVWIEGDQSAGVLDTIVKIFKFIINILITLFDVLIKIFNWILGLFS